MKQEDGGAEYKTSKPSSTKGGGQRRSSSAGLVSRGHSSENENSVAADYISEVDNEKELLKNPTQSREKNFDKLKDY